MMRGLHGMEGFGCITGCRAETATRDGKLCKLYDTRLDICKCSAHADVDVCTELPYFE